MALRTADALLQRALGRFIDAEARGEEPDLETFLEHHPGVPRAVLEQHIAAYLELRDALFGDVR